MDRTKRSVETLAKVMDRRSKDIVLSLVEKYETGKNMLDANRRHAATATSSH